MDYITTPDIDLRLPQESLCSMHPKYTHALSEHNIYIVGDLHGSFLKLISVLIHFGFIQYKSLFAHQMLLDLNAQLMDGIPAILMGDGLTAKKFYLDILNSAFYVNHHQDACFIFNGDTYCDRGASDFVTFCVFDWMTTCSIKFHLILGNHEFTVNSAEGFSDHPNPKYFQLPTAPEPEWGAYFRSFDALRMSRSCYNTFLAMYHSLLQKTHLFAIFFEKHNDLPIIISHAPIHRKPFANLLKKLTKEGVNIPPFFSKNKFTPHLLDEINLYLRSLFMRVTSPLGLPSLTQEELRVFRAIGDFCENRDTTAPILADSPVNHFGLKMGVNIFGHLSFPIHTPNMWGLDSITGMPHMPCGTVNYACLSV